MCLLQIGLPQSRTPKSALMCIKAQIVQVNLGSVTEEPARSRRNCATFWSPPHRKKSLLAYRNEKGTPTAHIYVRAKSSWTSRNGLWAEMFTMAPTFHCVCSRRMLGRGARRRCRGERRRSWTARAQAKAQGAQGVHMKKIEKASNLATFSYLHGPQVGMSRTTAIFDGSEIGMSRKY